MGTLTELLAGLRDSSIEVVDLTAPLHGATPILALPEQFGQTEPFQLHEISRYDDRGPAWYWNNFTTGEHTGTHFDAPVHWVTGRDGDDVATVPPTRLVGPAVVLDHAAEAAEDPDFLLEIDHVRAFEDAHGPIPAGAWLLYRTGWDAHSHDAGAYANVDDSGSHTPGIAGECARYLAEETDILGLGVETVGTDAGAAPGFDPPFPCHAFLLGAGKYGLTQLRNVGQLPPTGAVVVASPLPIVGGSGSPARVLALVER